MRSFISIFFFLIFISTPIMGQIEDIKEKSKEQEEKKKEDEDEKKDKGKRRTESGTDDYGFMESFASSCAETVFEFGFQVISTTLIHHHKAMMQNRDMYPEALSLDIMPQMAFSPEFNTWAIMPRVRGTWGVLSSDLRYSFMHDSTGNLQLIDWQILQINLNWSPNFRMRFGSGILHNNYVNKAYNEHSLIFDIGLSEIWELSLEGRIALDYDPEAPERNVFTEGAARTGIRIARTNELMVFISAGYVYQKFYDSIELNAASAGFRLVFY